MTSILISSPNAKTQIPLVDNKPDWTGITDPTLSILQAAFGAGDYEIVPDPEPVVEQPVPGWTPFNFALFTDPSFIAYGLAAQAVNPYLVPALIERYGQIAKEGLVESDFNSYWQAFCGALGVTAEHRNAWAALAAHFNLPTEFIDVIGAAQPSQQ